MAWAVDVLVSSLTDTPDPAVRGGNITFTITAENSAADTASNVVVTYVLPANTQFVSVADAAVPGACVHDGASPGVVTCTYASLLGTQAATAGPVRTIDVVLRTTGASVTTLASTVNVTTSDVDVNPANNSLSQNTTINDGADLSAVLSGSPDPATGGGLVSWTVSGSNLGPNTSGAISFVTTLPGVLTYVSAGSGGSGWSCGAAGQVVTCTRAAVPTGVYASFPIVTRITGVASGTVTLNGNISSSVADPDLSNNLTVASVAVDPGTDLAVTQDAISPNPATAGNAVTFVLRPSNSGPYPATAGANVTFPLPAGFAVTSTIGSAGWACLSDAGSPVTVTCTFAGSLAAAAGGVLTVVATAPTVASVTAFNNITATIAPNPGGPADPVAANNTAARNLTVAPDGVDLSVTKNKTPTIVAQLANMTSVLLVSNAGPRNAASGTVTLVDALDPAKEAFVSFSGTNWACVSAAPNVNCTYNTTLNSGASTTLTIVTQALAAGIATNNATTGYSGTPGDYNSANDTIPASVTVTAVSNSPDLSVGVSASTAGGVATQVEFNETSITYSVLLTNKNTTTADAQSVAMVLSIPGRTTNTPVTVTGNVLTNTSGASTATFTCAGTGTGSTGNVTCTQAGGTLLKPGDVMTFTVRADRPMNDGGFIATATANSSTQGDPLPADNSATVAVVIDPIADVEVVSKVLAANPVLAGTNAIYTITLRNNGPSSSAGVSVADVFTIPGGDAGFTFISATASNSGSCVGLTAGTSYTSGAPTLTCSWVAVVTNGATRTMTVTVRPNWQSGAAARTLDNTATVSATTPEDSVGGTGTAANSKSLTLNINPAQVDLLINNTDTPDPLGFDPVTATNDDVTYTVATTNNGPSLASGAGFTFTMTPPAGKTITFRGDGSAAGVAASNPSGTIPGSICDQVGTPVTGSATLTLTCTFAAPGQMTSGQTINRYLVFRVGTVPNTGGDTYATNATVFRNETDSNAGNDSEGETTTVRVRADLSVTKTPSVTPAHIRQPFDWTLVVSNAGPGDSQITGLTDTLPAGMVFSGAAPSWATSSGGSGTCSTLGQVMTCAFGTLPASQATTVTVPVRMTAYPSGGTVQNCATATTSEIDPNSVNNLNVCTTLPVQHSSLAGTVFQDRDRVGGNGGTPQAAGTEPRIANVSVNLSGTDAYGNTVNLTALTDASGNYRFTDLSPSDPSGYTLTQTQPAGFVNGPVSPPAPAESGVYAGGGVAGNSSYATIVLGANKTGIGYDFPEVRQPSLGGFVYIDNNLNGVRNAGTDTAINGATVRLLNAGTLAVVATTTSNASGAYSFANLDPLIAYIVEEPLPTVPAGLVNGPVNPGLINGSACAGGCTAQPDVPAAGTDRIAAIDLGAGTDGTLFNFGEIVVTSISGTVYLDLDRDGVIDVTPTDGRLAGVSLALYAGSTCSGGALGSTTTDASGNYGFPSAPVGATYTVCETQPTGYGEGSINPGTNGASNAANAITVTALPGSGSAGNNFGERIGSLAGAVYVDYSAGTPANTNNGVRDAGEAGIAGITVTLSGHDILGATINRTAPTDASGNYRFDDLLQSDATGYTLTEGAVAASYLDGKDTAGSVGGSVAVNDVFSGIVLAGGVQATAYNFGELPNASIAGTVYVDRNRNDAIDGTPTDARLVGVSVRLVQGADCASGTTLQTTATDASGNYAFTSLAGGSAFLVCEAQPAGYANGAENPGTSATTPAANTIAITNLPSAGSAGNNFGERVAAIAGSVFTDFSAGTPANTNNGVRDAGETGIANVPVTLTGRDAAGNTINLATTTDASGNYGFNDLLAADATGYTVTEGVIPPAAGTFNDGIDTAGSAGGSSAISDRFGSIALAAGVQGTGYNFGELPIAPISGTVYLDRDRDGVMAAFPTDGRLAGVTISIYTGATCSGTLVATTTTDASGNYTYSGASAGVTHSLCETQPAGYGDGTTTPGTNGTSGTPNTITIANLPASGSVGNNFGERIGYLAGSVYLDFNAATPASFNNGVRDAGETGLANVPVTLSGLDISGAVVSQSIVTDVSGNYRFNDLLQSNAAGYTVSEGAIPSASGSVVDGKDTAGSAGGSSAVNDAISAIVLGGGVQASGYNFGELPNASISGTVYVDRNRNNAIDTTPTDARIAGASVRLVQGADCSSGSTLQTVTTDASGNYAFSGLAGGSAFLVCETQPAGYVNGVENPGTGAATPAVNTIAIANLPSTGSIGNHFGERVGSLAGSVYADFTATTPTLTNNGVRDAGETGIANVPVTLTGRDAAGNTINLVATTDASGNYRFDDLLAPDASGYSVAEGVIPPASGVFNDGLDTAGTSGGSVAVNDRISAIALAAGAQATGYNFGELPNAVIGGTVYIDRNRSNAIDATPTDGRVAGVAVRLVQGADCASGTTLQSTSSDDAGSYSFNNVSAGANYLVCETQPAGYGNGAENPGTAGSTPTSNTILITNLPNGGSSGNNFGERVASIAGAVYLDANNDGARQAAEAGIAGVTVTLSGVDAAGSAVNRSVTSDASGAFRFDDLLAASGAGYTLTEQATQPSVNGVLTLNARTLPGTIGGSASGTASGVATLPSAVSAIALPAGGDSMNNLFGEILPIGISGTVFVDPDNNGVANTTADTGLANVAIVLSGSNDIGATVNRNATTAADGSFSFADLRPGTYTLSEPTQPTGTSNGLTVPGSTGGTATSVTTLPSAITAIPLTTPGTSSSANNFAEVPTIGAIRGRVWLDLNNNGLIDGSEAGIAGVSIELAGSDSTGQAIARTATSDASGAFAFEGLAPGSYALREPTQPATTVNGITVVGSAGGTASAVVTLPSGIAGIALAAGQVSSANNFGELPTAEIAGRVYADNNNNGTIDTGENGIGSVTLVLTGTDDTGSAVNVSTTNAADGSYNFTGLRPGTYIVTEPTQPTGTLNGITTAGTLGGKATAVASTPSAIAAIVLPPGARSAQNNFGELGNSPDLRVSKSHVEARFTVNNPGTYRLTVRNAGQVATSGDYTVTDRLPTGLTLAATPTGSGWACVGAVDASSFTCTSNMVLAPSASASVITAMMKVGAQAAANSPVNNAAMVEGGGELEVRRPSTAEREAFTSNPAGLPVCDAAITQNVCRDATTVQLAAALSGTVWYDIGSSSALLDGGDRRLKDWQVEVSLAASGEIVGRATTAADGSYRVGDLLPGVALAVRFREPQSNIVFGYPVNGESAPGSSGAGCNPGAAQVNGSASSCVVQDSNPQLTVLLAAGQELPQQSLPVDPSGVVYDSGLREPVPGAVVSLTPVGACTGWNPAAQIVGATLGGYRIDGNAIAMTVGIDGLYQFLFAPSAPASCQFALSVVPPAGYTFASALIPPAAGSLSAPGGVGSTFKVQPQPGAPSAAVGPATTYYLALTSGSAGASIIHNHIPVDAASPTGLTLSKTGDKSIAELGDTVLYGIAVRVTAGALPRQLTVVDRLPPGFTYVKGTAMVDGVGIADPAGAPGPQLAFNLGRMPAAGQALLQYRVRVGVGSQQGDGINRARAYACSVPQGCVAADHVTPLPGSTATNEGTFKVRVTGGVFTTEACVAGKIFVDCNGNHMQDSEELGIPGVRLVLQDGTTLISDSEGKYSICGLPPKSHVLKVDASTLPPGSRLTTSSNRNLGDAGSLWLDLKNGELHRADFIEGSCANPVLEQVKARRAQGEVRAPETEKPKGPALRFESKGSAAPRQATDSARQPVPKPRTSADPPGTTLPIPPGPDAGNSPDGAAHGTR